jgi:hypothetical protein
LQNKIFVGKIIFGWANWPWVELGGRGNGLGGLGIDGFGFGGWSMGGGGFWEGVGESVRMGFENKIKFILKKLFYQNQGRSNWQTPIFM